MNLNEAIEEVMNTYSQGAFIKFQALIRNQMLNLQEVKSIQNVLTMLLKEKEKENCEFMLEAIQIFLQKYHAQLFDWLYILLMHLIIRQSSAKIDSHTRALQDTEDIIRSLFSQRVVLQLCCKFVVDNVQTQDSLIKTNLLRFIRLLVVSMKSDILNNVFPDLIMAISRIISWTVDIKSAKVRKESEIVIHKFLNLNPPQFLNIIKSLPGGFQERAKIILKDNLAFGSYYEKKAVKPESNDILGNITQIDNSITLATNETVYPRPGLFEMSNLNFQQRYMSNTNHGNKVESLASQNASSMISLTNNDSKRISKHSKAKDGINQQKRLSDVGEVIQSDYYYQMKDHNSKTSSYLDNTNDTYNSDDSLFFPERKTDKSKSRLQQKKLKSNLTTVQYPDFEDPNSLIRAIIQELSWHNERHQERKLSLISLINCIHSDVAICWDDYFKTVMSILLETLGDNEGGTRRLAILSIQELAKVEPQRFQDQILLIITKLLHRFMDSDQGVIEAIKSCIIIFSQYLNVDTLWRTLNIIIVENEKEMQFSGLKFMQYVINASSPVIVSSLLVETLSLLNKLTVHKDPKNRKNSMYCLIAIYKKIGDKMWPYLKNFEKTKIRLLQIYVHRLK